MPTRRGASLAGAATGCRIEQPTDILFRGRIGSDDPVQPPQERQAGRGLAFQQDYDERKIGRRLGPFVERLGPTRSPISRIKAVASAISWASCADQEPPARMCVGAKNTRDAESLRSIAALSRSASA
jgi:hypothetical protein